MNQKIARQPASSSMPCPMVGASIGTVKKITAIMDCSRAIRSPEKRSRISAGGTTASAALAIPPRTRRTSRVLNSVTIAQAAEVIT